MGRSAVPDATVAPVLSQPAAGALVTGGPAPRPQRRRLHGRHVDLAPLADEHLEALYHATHGAGQAALWRFLFDGPFSDWEAFRAAGRGKVQSDDPLFFALLDKARQTAIGYLALMRIEPAHRCIEIGSILFAPAVQRTAGATEAIYLMASHVFDDLGYRRLEWKTDNLNVASKRAAARLGFTHEGVFRQHMIVKQRSRDTAWFSMLDTEWPVRKTAMERWLAPANFDAEGRQRISLSSLNGAAGS